MSLSRNRGRKKAVPKDPQLQLAIAISASLHDESQKQMEAERLYLLEIGLKEEAEALEKELKEKEESQNKWEFKKPEKPGNSNAGVSGVGNGAGGKRRKKGKVSKDTKLFTITQEEREINLGLRLTNILQEEKKKRKRKSFSLFPNAYFPEKMVPDALLDLNDESLRLWSYSSDETKDTKSDFTIPALAESRLRVEEEDRKFLKILEEQKIIKMRKNFQNFQNSNVISQSHSQIPFTNTNTEISKVAFKRTRSSSSIPLTSMTSSSTSSQNPKRFLPTECNTVTDGTLQALSDLQSLFLKPTDSDISLYGREEKRIRAHKIILRARCPDLLQEIITSDKGKDEIPLTDFSHLALKSFLWYIYSGQIHPAATVKQVAIEVDRLSELFNLPIYRTQFPIKGQELEKPKNQGQSQSQGQSQGHLGSRQGQSQCKNKSASTQTEFSSKNNETQTAVLESSEKGVQFCPGIESRDVEIQFCPEFSEMEIQTDNKPEIIEIDNENDENNDFDNNIPLFDYGYDPLYENYPENPIFIQDEIENEEEKEDDDSILEISLEKESYKTPVQHQRQCQPSKRRKTGENVKNKKIDDLFSPISASSSATTPTPFPVTPVSSPGVLSEKSVNDLWSSSIDEDRLVKLVEEQEKNMENEQIPTNNENHENQNKSLDNFDKFLEDNNGDDDDYDGRRWPNSQPQPQTPITPMPNYNAMDTPLLKNELKRYGLKAVKRPKAKIILEYIYKEMHKN